LYRFNGKVAVVTGGAHGIGDAIVQRLSAEGAQVVIADVNRAAGEALASSTGALFAEADVASHDAVSRLVEWTTQQYGRLDIVVSNAAVFHSGLVEKMSPAKWNEVLAVNRSATYHLAHFAAPYLRAQPGASIVIMSSVQGFVGFKKYSAYAASKGGLIGLMRQLATELAPEVRVNSISPGTIQSHPETPLKPATERKWARRHLLRRIGQPIEVANDVVFLASSEASFITGHNLVVDGGLTAVGE
jgi:NAD(P)-dependent dehydrogenase (short-subunit alcohol dehydrogenase family)